jgi:hypothetical protein
MVAKRSATGECIQTINQARALVLTGPDDLRARFAKHTAAALAAGTASLRPRPGDVIGYAVRVALRELGRRAEFPGRPARAPRRVHRSARDSAPPGFSPSTGSAPIPRRCCSSRRGSSRTAAQRGRLGAPVRRDRALSSILQIERIAPHKTRINPAAREVVSHLLRARRKNDLVELALRTGVA